MNGAVFFHFVGCPVIELNVKKIKHRFCITCIIFKLWTCKCPSLATIYLHLELYFHACYKYRFGGTCMSWSYMVFRLGDMTRRHLFMNSWKITWINDCILRIVAKQMWQFVNIFVVLNKCCQSFVPLYWNMSFKYMYIKTDWIKPFFWYL